MGGEIEPFLDKIKLKKIAIIGRIKYYTGTFFGKEVVMCVCGIGKVNAAAAAQAMFLKFKPCLVFNFGLAGSSSEMVSVGDIIIAKHVVQYDVDTSALGDPVGMISTINLVKLPCYNLLSKKIFESLKKNSGIRFGAVASGDKFLNSKLEICKINKKFDALAIDMEAGSLAQVCYLNNTNFICLKIISDSVFESFGRELVAKEYLKNKETLPNTLCDIVYDVIKNLI